MSGWGKTTIRGWELDEAVPKPSSCRELANAIGVSHEWIMGFSLATYHVNGIKR
jgi:hypothetical protein